MGSACDVLTNNPNRFAVYILSNIKIRDSIYDKKSFLIALRKILKTDSSMRNILDGLKDAKDTLDACSDAIFKTKTIQNLIRRNSKTKKKELRKRVKKEHPTWKRGRVTKEVNRRFKISIGVTEAKIQKTKQVSIARALRPVEVKGYTRKGKKVKKYYRSKRRPLTKAEEMLIKNNLKKKPADIIKLYYDSGLTFRSKTSIRRHIYRMRKKKNK